MAYIVNVKHVHDLACGKQMLTQLFCSYFFLMVNGIPYFYMAYKKGSVMGCVPKNRPSPKSSFWWVGNGGNPSIPSSGRTRQLKPRNVVSRTFFKQGNLENQTLFFLTRGGQSTSCFFLHKQGSLQSSISLLSILVQTAPPVYSQTKNVRKSDDGQISVGH